MPFLRDAREAQDRAQLAREIVVDDDDARLDEHLTHGNIEGCNQAPNVGETLGGVLQQQGVGAIVDRHVTARRQQRAALST